MTTERTPSERRVVWLLIAGLVWIFGLGAPAEALEVAPSAAAAGVSSGAASEQPPEDDGDDSGDAPDDEGDEETPDDDTEDTEDADDADDSGDEPAPEPGNVPIIAWIGASVLVLAAIAWAVNVARD